MPTYSMSAPDGNTYKIDGPAGASDEQVRAEILRQHPNAGTAGGGGDGGGGMMGRIASGIWRGVSGGMLPSDVAHFDPQTKQYVTGPSRQEEARKPTDRTSRLSELAGEMMVQPWIGGAKAASMGGRVLTDPKAKSLLSTLGRAFGGSWAESRAADKAMGTLGQRTGRPGIQALEESSAVYPGGGALRKKLVAAGTQREVMSAQEIAANMETAAGKFKGFSEGRAAASQRLSEMLVNTKGAVDADKFMQEWLKMAPAERDTIFGSKAVGGEFGKKMTELATNIEKIQQLATRRPLRDLAQKIPQSIKGTTGAAVVLGGAWNAGAIIHALLNWKTTALVATGATLAGTSNLMLSKALTNPDTVAWLAAQSGRMLYSLKTRDKGTYDEPLSHLEGDLR